MNGRAIRIVYGKELRDSLRDRRTIISMIVVPVLVMPMLMFGVGTLMFKTMMKARQEIPHVMSEAEKLCDRIGIIDRGRLLVDGTLAELRTQYGAPDLEDIFVRVVEGRP